MSKSGSGKPLLEYRIPVGLKIVEHYVTGHQLERAAGKPVRLSQKSWYYESPYEDFWVYKMDVYVTDALGLSPEDVLALLNEEANKRRLQLAKAHALQAMTEHLSAKPRRQAIPQDVKIAVWQRDGGTCVECGSREDLEFDHVIPLALGGSNTMRNLQLLCAGCNRRKGASLG